MKRPRNRSRISAQSVMTNAWVCTHADRDVEGVTPERS